MKAGDRVATEHDFLSNGVILRKVEGLGFIVKLDKKAPNTYAWNTDEVLLFGNQLRLEK